MAKRVRKRNKKRMRAFAVGFVALAFIIAAVLISQQKKLDAIAEEQAQLQEVIAAQNEGQPVLRSPLRPASST